MPLVDLPFPRDGFVSVAVMWNEGERVARAIVHVRAELFESPDHADMVVQELRHAMRAGPQRGTSAPFG